MSKTTLLILLSTFTTLIYLVFGENFPFDLFIFSYENLKRGYFWSPITSLFIHADFFHLVGNMLFLYAFGRTVEKEIGSGKTMFAFFLGGILSFILSAPFYEANVRMIGASAAIFTLVSMTILIKPLKFSWIFFMPLGLVAIIYFLYNVFAIVYMEIGLTGISYIGHVIGFIVGIPLGVAWSRGKWKRNIFITIGLLIVYMTIINIFLFL